MDVIDWLAKRISNAADRPFYGALALTFLCFAVYLPGVLRLPAVDRTEVIWADSARDMVERGNWLDPRYGKDEVHAFRPIGTFWAEATAASALGGKDAREIRIYRLPALLFVTAAVVALYLLSQPLVGGFAAFTAATLFAVAPLTVLVGTLAIAEGLSLLPAVVAMLVVLRLYASEGEPPRMLWLLFWIALGVAMLVNALLVPILVAATLIALFVMDRDLSWLKKLRPLAGIPVALLIASPWLIVRVMQDGIPFAWMTWPEFLAALGGAQDMKLRAFPGTFLLALLLGFLPGTVLVAPAAVRAWQTRSTDKIARFLIAWVLGYLIYLEALSSKPGTYMVQTMYPALALGVALVIRDHAVGSPAPKFHGFVWPPLAAAFPVAILASVVVFAGQRPGILTVAAYALVAWLFAMSAQDGRAGNLRRWAVSGTLALGAFAIALLGVVLPSIERIWPARQIASHIDTACDPGLSVGLLGLREPSARFAFGHERATLDPQSMAEAAPDLAYVESRWRARYEAAMKAAPGGPGKILGCIESFNVMRGCPLTFAVYARSAPDLCFDSAATTCSPETMTRPSGSSCD